ncbi:type VII secretion integral membrane protein EccD [Klenkia soli]|uniref:Type VII secretion integral membrane protein EccD n=1 Tax=Klenkia soli TaxID=1052260 RepID=A0A1H0TF58_9ACTN|nr:type VII secretion integral membrane protein EccD [Klenkia soli]SDP52624.1 type VII secretion integral membrane protein EccD [Klenkia soli]
MTRSVGQGLARVTVAAPTRRVDVALPDGVAVAELLPMLLRHAGDELADLGQEQGGWVLRRPDGSSVEPDRSLAAQEVRDGDVLHLVPSREQWPELDYDDVVDAIARSARDRSRSWGSAATRRAGIATGVVGLVLAALVTAGTGPEDWGRAGGVLLGLAVVALVAAVLLARAVGDAGAAVPFGTVAQLTAAGGALVVGLGAQPLATLGPWQWLAGALALVAVSLVVLAAVSVSAEGPVAGAALGLLGAVAAAAALTDAVDALSAAALVAALTVVLVPALPILSVRLGKVPMPLLPSTTEDLLADGPQVPRSRVAARVRRADELLTGLLAGFAVAALAAGVVLVADGGRAGLVLVALVAVGGLLRSRLFPASRHRLPLVATGLGGVVLLVLAALALDAAQQLRYLVPALVVLALAALVALLRFQDRAPSPYLGRVADVLDVLVVLAVVPVACLVAGLYGYVRGLYG